jgi:hypothetical protein
MKKVEVVHIMKYKCTNCLKEYDKDYEAAGCLCKVDVGISLMAATITSASIDWCGNSYALDGKVEVVFGGPKEDPPTFVFDVNIENDGGDLTPSFDVDDDFPMDWYEFEEYFWDCWNEGLIEFKFAEDFKIKMHLLGKDFDLIVTP